MQISRSQNKTNKVNSNVKLSDNQYGYSKSSEPHDNWTYDLGIGTNNLKTLIGTTYSYTDGQPGYDYQHKAGDSFGVANARRKDREYIGPWQLRNISQSNTYMIFWYVRRLTIETASGLPKILTSIW